MASLKITYNDLESAAQGAGAGGMFLNEALATFKGASALDDGVFSNKGAGAAEWYEKQVATMLKVSGSLSDSFVAFQEGFLAVATVFQYLDTAAAKAATPSKGGH